MNHSVHPYGTIGYYVIKCQVLSLLRNLSHFTSFVRLIIVKKKSTRRKRHKLYPEKSGVLEPTESHQRIQQPEAGATVRRGRPWSRISARTCRSWPWTARSRRSPRARRRNARRRRARPRRCSRSRRARRRRGPRVGGRQTGRTGPARRPAPHAARRPRRSPGSAAEEPGRRRRRRCRPGAGDSGGGRSRPSGCSRSARRGRGWTARARAAAWSRSAPPARR